MRKAMIQAVSNMIAEYNNTALLLIDIGAWAFREVLEGYPERAKNIGIFEPGTIGLAAGLALAGITPTVYGISPFIVQRALEQLKLDFVYQNIGGNFITTGASYDFSSLGYSHYCPEDIATLKLLPGMEVVAPGTPAQFNALFAACWNDGHPTYFRMTDHCNQTEVSVEFGKASVLKRGTKATVITSAEMLDASLEACSGLDVTVLYYTTLAPFDRTALIKNFVGGKIFVCTPYYIGTLTNDILQALNGTPIQIEEVGVPLQILRTYGTKKEKDAHLGLDAKSIRERLVAFVR